MHSKQCSISKLNWACELSRWLSGPHWDYILSGGRAPSRRWGLPGQLRQRCCRQCQCTVSPTGSAAPEASAWGTWQWLGKSRKTSIEWRTRWNIRKVTLWKGPPLWDQPTTDWLVFKATNFIISLLNISRVNLIWLSNVPALFQVLLIFVNDLKGLFKITRLPDLTRSISDLPFQVWGLEAVLELNWKVALSFLLR